MQDNESFIKYQLTGLPFNYEKFAIGIHNTIPGDDSGIIEKGCCVSSLKKMPPNWNDKKKSVKWECGYHQAFTIPLLNFCTSQVIHPINLQNFQKNILTNKQKERIIQIFLKTLKSCPVCKLIPFAIPEILKPYYRLPNNCGTIIQFNATIDRNILDYDIKSEEPILIDTEGYRGVGLSVLHKDGFSFVNRDEYYPIWQLHKEYITPNVIDSFYDSTEGFKINSNLTIYIHDNDRKPIDKNINEAIVISDEDIFKLNNEELFKMIDEKPVLINYNNSKLFIKQEYGDTPCIYVASFYDESKNINFYFTKEKN